MQWVSAGAVEGDIKVRTAMARISLWGMDVVSKILQDMVDFKCRIGCLPCRLPPLNILAVHSY